MPNENLIKIEHFCQSHGIEDSFIFDLNESGLVEIIIMEDKRYLSATQLADVEKMIRLHYGLNINIEGIEAIINLLERIDGLQKEITTIQNRLNFYNAK